jgi:aminopeptidase N
MASLTRSEAIVRADLLRVDAYRIDLDLAGADRSDRFESTTTITFSCRRPGEPTFVEVKPDQLHEVRLNGVPVDPALLRGNRLPLTGLASENEIVVRATMRCSNTGEGLHRFVDPEDGCVYLYAQAFLDDAQRIFACFDQPDLKATFTLAVTAPPDWVVAGNGAGCEVAPDSPGPDRVGSVRWEFDTTAPISTYLVSLIAGPYHVRRDTHDGIPLALYCRRGVAAHLDKDVDEILGYTRAAFDTYHELFGVRYPFGKYDQAFVPEFNAGAMENVGLVTFRDDYIFRSAVADDQRELRAKVIAHEMAHMWFGDLVTMRWWDDLWLNESFAEYLANRVVGDATRFTSSWTGFVVGRKAWGYAADQRPSTHPVAPPELEDSADALFNFDGISYAKGAAVLRQLVAWLSDDVFLAGLREHIRTHAFGNATLADLLDALGTAAGRDLSGWAEVWLRRPQVNTLRPRGGLDGARYQEVVVEQTAPAAYPTLRPHLIHVGVYSGGALSRRVAVVLDPTVDGGRTPVPELAGVERGDLLLLNDGDLTYAKIRFDPATRAALPSVLPSLTDSLARALVWAAVADAARDGEVPMRDFVDLLVTGLPAETEEMIVNDLIRFATTRPPDSYFPLAASVPRFTAPENLDATEARVAAACYEALRRAAPGSGLQLLAAGGYAGCAGNSEVGRLRDWLAGRVPAGLDVDADLRWSLLSRLCALGEAGAADVEAEVARDRTASGTQHAARCRALLPDPVAKAAAWHILMRDDALSNRLVVATGDGFWHPRQAELTRPYVDKFFDEAPAMAARRTPAIVKRATEVAFPRHAVELRTQQLAEAMLARTDLTNGLRRVVGDLTDELRRAVAGRTLDRS